MKLRGLGVNTECAKLFVNDIFGQQQGTHLFCELVDCDSEAEFDEKLCQLKDVWNKREMDARKTSLPEFHAWFTRYHAINMKHKILKGLREKVGLGSPPVQFTNNPNESVNAWIKEKVDYKKSEHPKLLSCSKDKPGASVIAASFATSSDVLDHIPLNTSLGSPISFQETEKGGTFSDTDLVFEDVCTSSAKQETGCLDTVSLAESMRIW